MTHTRTFDAIVLGGGAAGLFCAVQAGKRGRRVAVLERNESIGKKILISGGGRCNFTNLHCRPENFLSDNPHFAKSALARFTPADFIALVEKHGITYHEKTLGQLFCDESARQIVAMLETECHAAKVHIITNVQIRDVQRGDHFVVSSENLEYRAPVLVVATGGLSIPKMGATAFGYELARQFGHRIVPTRPALVPLLFNFADRKRYAELAGVSAEVVASSDSRRFREKMLFTHRGLSGPAILQISSYWKEGEGISLDLAPERDALGALRASSTRNLETARKVLQSFLPNRFASLWLDSYAPMSFTKASLDSMERQLHHWRITPSGSEGYAKAEVTAGGVDTRELSSKTMESQKLPGLYFIGEVVDVTGQLGGFNFQWAWASGAAAGRSL
jgi:predicted Rossmann fold flavoprotein